MKTRPRRPWWRDDRGSATSEVVLLTPLLIMLLVFVAVSVHRGVDARLRLNDAAHQAARAASLERTLAGASTRAHATAAATLTAAGVVCRSMSADIATEGLRPGSSVTATVSCEVDLGDALLPGIGTTRLSATAIETVDVYRSADSPSR
ncbi:TadE/TadG family type IV pilus assembly protein [Lentzea sp. HUAS12]|uniref:TadE/TadG family type IV pilus assembly protein n=1 Tax=Lentzea sp. HUAS12 TaxID=2951806 RepID=UPI00209D6796|nr:TadE/TadG family type IV pilus assembly protein [Lentzea sp. HUAS12]USX56428.1 pilus assembly protein [Lentzea sp. HUAS12]